MELKTKRNLTALILRILLMIGFASCNNFQNSPTSLERVEDRILYKSPTAVSTSVIAFRSERDGNTEIYLINSDGTGLLRLINDPDVDQVPSWSPDGSQIAFASTRSGNPDIFKMNSDGSNQLNLSNNPAGDGSKPYWSPDGTQIVFSSTRDGQQEIYKMSSDGTNQERLTNNPSDDGAPSWSPDGTQIAFTSDRDNNPGVGGIYLMNSDGTNVTSLLVEPGFQNGEPVWSPDGSKILFISNRPGSLGPDDVWVMDAVGTNLVNLTNSTDDVSGGGAGIAWSPDGTQIAFSTNRDGGNWEIYIMNADGSNPTRLTDNHPSDDLQPHWGILLKSVEIDIKPGSNTNPINLKSKGKIPVAILTTEGFDATTVDASTITFGDDDGNDTPVAIKRNGSLMASIEDIDLDNDLDLLLHFKTQALVQNGDVSPTSTKLVLNGQKFDGVSITGSDVIKIVP